MTVAPRRSPALGATLATVVTLEALRVFLPTALVVLPEDTGVSGWGAVAIGAVVVALVPLAVVPLARRAAASLWVGAGVLGVLARGALLVDPGGVVQLVAAALGTAAGLAALVAVAAGARSARAARVGIVVGLALEALLRTVFEAAGPVWSDTLVATAVSVALLAAYVAAIGRTAEHLDAAAQRHGSAAWTWWWLLAALPLSGTFTTASGRVAEATGWPPVPVAVAIATAQVAAVVAALVAPRLAPATAAVLGGALTLVGTAAALPATGWAGTLGPVALAVGLGILAGTETGAGDPSGPGQRARVAASALAAGHVLVVLYYLGPDLGLAGITGLLPLAPAAVAALLAFAGVRRRRFVPLRPRLRGAALVQSAGLGLVTIAAVGALVAAGTRDPAPAPPDDGTLTVATFQLRAGFGTDGRYDPRRQAALLAARAADVVVVTGVDRGRWLTGGQDLLPAFARELGLEHVRFVPTSHAVLGHALLTRYPIEEFATLPLPSEPGRPEHRLLSAVLLLDDGTPVAVVGTELASGPGDEALQRAQARAVAGTVARLRERDLPTILLAALDATEDGPTLDSFAPLLRSALPEGARNSPSAAPTTLTAHVLLSEELRRSTVEIPTSPASSHLPVIVTVERVATSA